MVASPAAATVESCERDAAEVMLEHNLRERLRSRTGDMLDAIQRIVDAESPSADIAALSACAEQISEIGRQLLGRPAEVVEAAGRSHLRWPAQRRARLAILGHYDTVWPMGTLDRRPFRIDGNRATGPGVFDMKAGIILGLHAIAESGCADYVEVLLTADEEIGSMSSRGIVEDLGRRVGAVLVLEPGVDGDLKTGRKGVAQYQIDIEGRAAHAGLEPERGVSALVELAHQVLALRGVARVDLGTTVTPTVANAGVAVNVVPPSARIMVDVRALTVAELDRVDTDMHQLTPALDGARVRVTGGVNRPPLETSASAELFARVRRIAAELGMPPPGGRVVGGGSDGNLTAAVGAPTLDGLGAVGGGAHAEDEHILVDALADRAALVAALVADSCADQGAVLS